MKMQRARGSGKMKKQAKPVNTCYLQAEQAGWAADRPVNNRRDRVALLWQPVNGRDLQAARTIQQMIGALTKFNWGRPVQHGT